MGIILCATRGGEASHRTQEQAIAVAKERDASLLFIFVADVKFLRRTHAAILVDVQTEIEHMGEFLLLMAKERAENAGVEADCLVTGGVFDEAIKKAAKENNVDLVIFGKPGEESSVTQVEYLESLGQAITDETGIETMIV